MKIVVDRFEGDYAVCEQPDRTMINIRQGKLPAGVKEGDVLVVNGDTITIDVAETAVRKQKARQLMDELFKPKAND